MFLVVAIGVALGVFLGGTALVIANYRMKRYVRTRLYEYERTKQYVRRTRPLMDNYVYLAASSVVPASLVVPAL